MNTNPARGMRDFLPEDVRRRQYVIGVIADVYQKNGVILVVDKVLMPAM